MKNDTDIFAVAQDTATTQDILDAFYRLVARYLSEVESPNVIDYGAGFGGDDDSAFTKAIAASKAAMNITGPRGTGGIPRALMCEVMIPAGTYTLTKKVNTGGKHVTYNVSPGAVINGFDYLNGRVNRRGQRYTCRATGSVDYGAGQSIRMGTGSTDSIAEIDGVPTPQGFGRYIGRDSVARYADCGSVPADISVGAATYTATSATIAPQSSDVVLGLQIGMYVTTFHTPNFYTGLLTGWNSDASVIQVDAWYLADNNLNPATTPPSTAGLMVNAYDKIWADNINIFLTAEGTARKGACTEAGIFNFRGDASPSLVVDVNQTWGFDAVSLGTGSFRNQVGHITRGVWQYHCASLGDIKYPYAAFDSSNFLLFRVDDTGSMERGKNGSGVSTVVYDDLHTSGNTVDYDIRLIGSGGTASNGGGTYQIAAALTVTGNHEPGTTNASNLGSAAKTWLAGFFATLNASVVVTDSIELGIGAGTKVLDFHSSGNAIDYDSRIEATGGSASVGAGALTARSASFDFAGVPRPLTDLGTTLGQTARRFVNGFIQSLRPGAGAVIWTSGSGTPNGTQSAPVGSLYTDTTGGAGTTLYVKETGAGNTGWVAK